MTMLAVRFGEFGDPEVLRVEEIAEPVAPSGDQLLVQVEASSVNGTDLGLRRGDAKLVTLGRMPFVLGFDVAGTVVACGPAVTAFRPGDKVMALLGHSGGGQAEQVLLRQNRAALTPRSVDAAAAAALPLAGLTALQAVHRHGRLGGFGSPARVLVLGAAGGIGSFAVQLAKIAGAHVTGAASGPKLGFVTDLGADAVLDYRRQDLTAVGERWDLIIDTPGRYRFHQLAGALTRTGVLVSTRPISPDVLRLAVPAVLRSRGPRFAVVATQACSQDLAHLAALVDHQLLRPAVDHVYPIFEAAAAHHRAAGAARGKVVLQIAT